jgi:hypothetical protein
MALDAVIARVGGYDDWGESGASIGALPTQAAWTTFHEIAAGEVGGFLGALDDDDKSTFQRMLDDLLQTQADKLGYLKASLSGAPRWIPVAPELRTEVSVPAPPPPVAHGSLKPRSLLTDVEMLATTFAEGEPWEKLLALLRTIRPLLYTSRGSKPAAAHDTLALIVVLKLLAQRAAQVRDTEAFQHAEQISSGQAGTVFALAWRGADAFGRSRAGGTGERARKKDSDEDLFGCAHALMTQGVSAKNLTTEIRARWPDRFGVEDHLRRRLQGLGLVPKRKPKPS